MTLRSTLRRWHIWLGWIVGLPILLWTVSGVIMVAKPIEEVRGADLLSEPAAVRIAGPVVPPAVSGVPLKKLSLEQRAGGPRWVAQLPDGTTRLADATTGQWYPQLSAADAMREVTARYTGKASVKSVGTTDAANPPIDLRRPIATWRVEMSDGTRFYVDAGSGEVVARRTAWWRFYDLMWGLHIMDPMGREDTHNPWVIGFGLVALLTTLLAVVMLPLTLRRRRRRDALAGISSARP